MMKPIDLSTDWLAEAPLTPDQRLIWNQIRHELARTRISLREKDRLIETLENAKWGDLPSTILTRPEFNREVTRMLAFNERYGGISSLLYYTFDGMKTVESKHGKLIAGEIIRTISKLLIKNLRRSDIISRLGPDDFGIMLMHCNNENAWSKGKLLSMELEKNLNEVGGCKIELIVSFGAHTLNENDDAASGIMTAVENMTKKI